MSGGSGAGKVVSGMEALPGYKASQTSIAHTFSLPSFSFPRRSPTPESLGPKLRMMDPVAEDAGIGSEPLSADRRFPLLFL